MSKSIRKGVGRRAGINQNWLYEDRLAAAGPVPTFCATSKTSAAYGRGAQTTVQPIEDHTSCLPRGRSIRGACRPANAKGTRVDAFDSPRRDLRRKSDGRRMRSFPNSITRIRDGRGTR